MRTKFILSLTALLLVLSFGFASAWPADSAKAVLRNGKNQVAHKVAPKETLYSISRKYKVPVRQIVEANPGMETAVKIGQVVYVPVPGTPKKVPAAKPAQPQTVKAAPVKMAAVTRVFTTDEKGNKWHTVAPGQTVFSIATMHSITVDELKKNNQLSGTDIQVGQKLLVGKQALAKQNKLEQYVPEKDDDMEASTAKPIPAKAPAVLAPAASPEPNAASPDREETDKSEPAKTEASKRMVQSGLAAVINTPFQSAKFLALHKTAPVGTMLQVKNSMNGKAVFVRVIGRLPDTGENDKVVVKISKKAYQALGALDAKFYAEVSYLQ